MAYQYEVLSVFEDRFYLLNINTLFYYPFFLYLLLKTSRFESFWFRFMSLP